MNMQNLILSLKLKALEVRDLNGISLNAQDSGCIFYWIEFNNTLNITFLVF